MTNIDYCVLQRAAETIGNLFPFIFPISKLNWYEFKFPISKCHNIDDRVIIHLCLQCRASNDVCT
jgi:hypothetical protein